MMTNIGFIGLGKMGYPMALNLLKKHRVFAYDINKRLKPDLIQKGASFCNTLNSLCTKNVSHIIIMLQTGEQVEEMCTSRGGIFDNVSSSTIIIDCSSIDIQTSLKLHNLAEKKSIPMLDAPVSGGIKGAREGTLTFMVGGKKDYFDNTQSILSIMGKNIIYAGKPGNGQVAKICNNMLLGISMIGVCEAFILSEKLGVDATTFYNIAKHASSQCWSMTSYAPVPNVVPDSPANNGFKPGFTSQMMLKDLLLSQTAAKLADIQTPMGKTASMLYKQFVMQGNEEIDFSGIINMLRDKKSI